jgi:hypothetical protein
MYSIATISFYSIDVAFYGTLILAGLMWLLIKVIYGKKKR